LTHQVALQIKPDGFAVEVYDGPAAPVWAAGVHMTIKIDFAESN
tara:strand:+ start:557 stop:688 length:132 start_codon:yes stop_codon:yes gene_type:complete